MSHWQQVVNNHNSGDSGRLIGYCECDSCNTPMGWTEHTQDDLCISRCHFDGLPYTEMLREVDGDVVELGADVVLECHLNAFSG